MAANESTEADYSVETWRVEPGASRTVDMVGIRRLRAGLIAGSLSVVGHDGDDARIEVEQVEQEAVHISLDDGTLSINQPKQQWKDFFGSVSGLVRGRISAHVTVMLPRAAAVKIGTTTAETLVAGMRAPVSVNTVSGEIQLSDVQGQIDINTASGRVDIDGLDGSLDLRSVSGELTVAGTGDRFGIETVSGDAVLDLTGSVRVVTLHSVSGDLTARIDASIGVRADFNSLSGSYAIGTQRGKGSADVTLDGQPVMQIGCSTVSGDLAIVRR